MDVLSDVITVMRTGRPRSAYVTWHAPWAQRFASVPGSAGFQVVLRGPCWLTAPGTDPIALAPGDIVFRPHGRGHTLADSPHRLPTGPPCGPGDVRHAAATVGSGGPATVTLCGAYELDPGHSHPLLDSLPELIHLSGPNSTVDLLAGELAHPRLGTDAVVPAMLDILLLHILRAWIDEHPATGDGATGWAAALNDPATAAALRAMHGDPARPWTVATLAAQAGQSRAAFARRFTALVGQPPLTYLTWWRMTSAARLLHESDAPLSVVAGRVGYTSEFAFAGAFKRRYGMPPGRYRRLRRR